MPSSSKKTVLLVIVILAAVITTGFVYRHCASEYKPPTSIPNYMEFRKTLKSGDLLLARENKMNYLHRWILGSNYVHVGVVYENQNTGELFALEWCANKVICRPLDARIAWYKRKFGPISVRRLNTKLHADQEKRLQDLVESLELEKPLDVPTRISKVIMPCIVRHLVHVEVSPIKDGAFCTDHLFLALQSIGLVKESSEVGCLEPHFFESNGWTSGRIINDHLVYPFEYEAQEHLLLHDIHTTEAPTQQNADYTNNDFTNAGIE
jgi:hypothetical protein